MLAEARSAGLLGEDIFLRTDMVADAGTTTFTTTANGETTVVSAYALGPEVPPGVTGSVADMYRKLAEFQAKLNTLQDWLPEGGIAEEETPYEITRLQIVAMPVDSLQIPLEPTGDPVPWPLDTPLGELGLPLAETDAQLGTLPEFGEARCAVFEGDAPPHWSTRSTPPIHRPHGRARARPTSSSHAPCSRTRPAAASPSPTGAPRPRTPRRRRNALRANRVRYPALRPLKRVAMRLASSPCRPGLKTPG